jgi:hypothetical protein
MSAGEPVDNLSGQLRSRKGPEITRARALNVTVLRTSHLRPIPVSPNLRGCNRAAVSALDSVANLPIVPMTVGIKGIGTCPAHGL